MDLSWHIFCAPLKWITHGCHFHCKDTNVFNQLRIFPMNIRKAVSVQKNIRPSCKDRNTLNLGCFLWWILKTLVWSIGWWCIGDRSWFMKEFFIGCPIGWEWLSRSRIESTGLGWRECFGVWCRGGRCLFFAGFLKWWAFGTWNFWLSVLRRAITSFSVNQRNPPNSYHT